MIFLSQHFTLDEMVHSQTANRLSIGNMPDDETEEGMAVINNLVRTAIGLEVVRKMVGGPIVISSGYRSEKLNAAIGGASNSQHMQGKAADITAPGFGTAPQLMKLIASHRSEVYYDQLILERHNPAVPTSGWVHISFDTNPRKQALVIDSAGTRNYTA